MLGPSPTMIDDFASNFSYTSRVTIISISSPRGLLMDIISNAKFTIIIRGNTAKNKTNELKYKLSEACVIGL